MPLRKRGPWWHYRFTINFQEYNGSTGLLATEANRKAAQRIEKEQRQLVLTGRVAETKKDFATAAAKFVVWCKDVEYRKKPSTAKRIGVSFASLVEFFGNMSVSEIGAGDVENYKTHRVQVNGVKDITLRHDLHALSLFFQYAAKQKWRDGNPVREVSIPSDADAVRMHPLTRDEEKYYFDAAFKVVDREGRRNLYDVAKVMLNQGCRPEEVMAAPKLAFNGAAGTLHVSGKSKAANRILYCTPDVVEILTARLTSSGPWLFPSERYPGNHITKLNNSHDRACREATNAWREDLIKQERTEEAKTIAVSFVIYDLRHTFGTRMATEEKIDPFTLATIMGHANLRTIMRYVHPDQKAQKDAMKRYAQAIQRRRLTVK